MKEDSPDRPSRLDALRAQVAGVTERVETAAEHIPALEAALQSRRRDRRVAGNVLASAMAYRLFLWILPLSLVLSAALGFLRSNAVDQPADVADDLGLSAYVASTVADAAAQAERSRWILLVIGIVGLYVASAGAARTLVTIHSLVWATGLPPKVSARGALAFAGIAFAALAIGVAAKVLDGGRLALIVPLEVVTLVCFGGLVLLTAWLLPHADAPWTALVPGAVLFAVGVVALRIFTSVYLVGRIQTSSELYGSLGAAAAIMLWLYFVGRLLVGAAVLNAALWSWRLGSLPVEQAQKAEEDHGADDGADHPARP